MIKTFYKTLYDKKLKDNNNTKHGGILFKGEKLSDILDEFSMLDKPPRNIGEVNKELESLGINHINYPSEIPIIAFAIYDNQTNEIIGNMTSLYYEELLRVATDHICQISNDEDILNEKDEEIILNMYDWTIIPIDLKTYGKIMDEKL